MGYFFMRKAEAIPRMEALKMLDQEKETSIALMETQKGAESEKSDIHCPYGEARSRGIRKFCLQLT